MQERRNSIANALELQLSSTNPSMHGVFLSHWGLLTHIQSSAVITRSNIVRFCINNCRNWDIISIRCWIHKRHPIPRPNGRAMRCLLWIFVIKLTALYRHRTVYVREPSHHWFRLSSAKPFPEPKLNYWLSVGPLGTTFNKIWNKIYNFPFEEIYFKMFKNVAQEPMS